MSKWKPWVSVHCLLILFMQLSYHLLLTAGHHQTDRETLWMQMNLRLVIPIINSYNDYTKTHSFKTTTNNSYHEKNIKYEKFIPCISFCMLATLMCFQTYSEVVLQQCCSTSLSLAVTLYTAKFNIKKCYVLSTQCIYVFCIISKNNSTSYNINRLVFYNLCRQCLLCSMH